MFDKWILLDWPATMRATSRNLIPWQERTNTRDGARASFRYANFWDFPSDCVIASDYQPPTPRSQALDTLTTIAGLHPRAIDWDARKRRAAEWVRTHKNLDGYPYNNEP
jgi:hypothetical protein